jgi:hypothetical protein
MAHHSTAALPGNPDVTIFREHPTVLHSLLSCCYGYAPYLCMSVLNWDAACWMVQTAARPNRDCLYIGLQSL